MGYIDLCLGHKTMSHNEIETIICRTDTWACKLMTWYVILTWVGIIFAFMASVGWLGILIVIPFSMMLYKFPVVIVIQLLTKSEEQQYLGSAAGADKD